MKAELLKSIKLNNCLIFDDTAHNGIKNMEIDNSLIQIYKHYKTPVIRFYSWLNPCFTIGFNQNPEDFLNLELCNNDNITISRRITGGGIFFHENDISYCFVSNFDENINVKSLYKIYTLFIFNFYKQLKLNPLYNNDKELKSGICHSLISQSDILINNKKIGGNAMRIFRNEKIFLIHGSIPLSIDFNKIKKYFLYFSNDIINNNITLSDLCPELYNENFKETLNVIKKSLINIFKETYKIDNLIQYNYEFENLIECNN